MRRLVVRDEEGRLAEAKVEVAPEFLTSLTGSADGETAAAVSGPSAPEGAGLALRAVLGVSLIFNIAAEGPLPALLTDEALLSQNGLEAPPRMRCLDQWDSQGLKSP